MSIIEPYINLFLELYDIFSRDNPEFKIDFSVERKLDLETDWRVLLSGSLSDINGINTNIFVELSYDSDSDDDVIEIKYIRPCDFGKADSKSLRILLKTATRLETEIINEHKVKVMHSVFIKLNRRAETIDDYLNDPEIVESFKKETRLFMNMAVNLVSSFLKDLLLYNLKYGKKLRKMYSD